MNVDDTRHLLRRLAFAATPDLERALRPFSRDAALALLVKNATSAAAPAPPPVVSQNWSNAALRTAAMTTAEYDALRAAQSRTSRDEIERLRQWWIGEAIASAAPLREWLVLLFHDTFGSSSATVDIPHALHGTNALLRRTCLDSIPALLEGLVADPAMMIQIGMDEHFKARVSDRPAKLILDRWTVGEGAYQDADVEELSRALTGWSLAAPPGREPAQQVDGSAPRVARRTGIVPVFDPRQFDAGSKTILGATGAFDAKSAIARLARHPATAKRFGRLLLQHLGVEDPGATLEGRLASVYQTTDGSIQALLHEVVRADAFWAPAARWTMVKSPVQLVVGACRQLTLSRPPLDAISRWLTATGQTLFDTPNAGEGSWPGQEQWVTPADRLTLRYQLPSVLGGQTMRSGLVAPSSESAAPLDLPLPATLRDATARAVSERLDPAPGVDLGALDRVTAGQGTSRGTEIVRRIMWTPNYQLA
jgi:uncharacterized protein (DUF1800 family)